MKMSQIETENTKKPKIFNFSKFMDLLLKFRQTSWIGMFYRVIKEKVGCPVVFNEAIISMFRMEVRATSWVRGSLNFPKFAKDIVSSFYHFLSFPKNLPGTRKPLFSNRDHKTFNVLLWRN